MDRPLCQQHFLKSQGISKVHFDVMLSAVKASLITYDEGCFISVGCPNVNWVLAKVGALTTLAV